MGRQTSEQATEAFRAVIIRSYPGTDRASFTSVFGPYARRSDARAAVTRETSWTPAGAIYTSKVQRSSLAWEDVE